jgi:ABC-type multidrug transport system ATPase subunit
MPSADTAVSVRNVSKDYRGLRPLRIQALEVREGETTALLGFDQAMAEVLVRMIMGASLPDEGEVTVLGQLTSTIADGDEWLEGLSRFGLLSDRAILVDQLTAEQTLAMPITFDPSDDTRRTIHRLAEEVGLERSALHQPVGGLPALARVRVRLGRALILGPRLLLAEHPTASLSPDDARAFASDFSRVVAGRALTTVVLTADPSFASAVARDVRALQPASGILTAASGWRRWFNR